MKIYLLKVYDIYVSGNMFIRITNSFAHNYYGQMHECFFAIRKGGNWTSDNFTSALCEPLRSSQRIRVEAWISHNYVINVTKVKDIYKDDSSTYFYHYRVKT